MDEDKALEELFQALVDDLLAVTSEKWNAMDKKDEK